MLLFEKIRANNFLNEASGMKKGLFNKKDIEPACLLCVHGKMAPDMKSILCIKKGLMRPESKCRHFEYDPLKRVPRRDPVLPALDPEDFKI
jgi:hypothetical protein